MGGVQTTGEILYNGEPFGSFFPERTAAYVDQVGFRLLKYLVLEAWVRSLVIVKWDFSSMRCVAVSALTIAYMQKHEACMLMHRWIHTWQS